MKPVKLAIIGCGLAARNIHWPALEKLKDKFEIVCVCNHTEQKAKDFAKLLGGVRHCTDYRQMLEDTDIEAVDIAVPIHLNYQVVKDSLAAGKHVIVEKPLAANMEQAKQMLKFPDQYQTVMMVAENLRYRPSTTKLKGYIDSGVIGKPYALFWDVFYRLTNENPYMQTQWRLDHKYPGGILLDGGVHLIAAIRTLVGDITELSSQAKSINPYIGSLDSLSMLFTTAQGVCGVCNMYNSAIGEVKNRLRILGDKGTLILTNNIIEIQTLKNNSKEEIQNDTGITEEFEDFINAIRKKSLVSSSFCQGYKDMEAIIAAVENKGGNLVNTSFIKVSNANS